SIAWPVGWSFWFAGLTPRDPLGDELSESCRLLRVGFSRVAVVEADEPPPVAGFEADNLASEVIPEEDDASQTGRRVGVEDLIRRDKAAVKHEVVAQRAPPHTSQELQVVFWDPWEPPADGGQLGFRKRLKPATWEDPVDRSEQPGVVGHVRSTP